jgi:WD40 repeat protein
MKDQRPNDRLSESSLRDTGPEKPGVYVLQREEHRWRVSRRNFLGAAVAAVAARRLAVAQQVTCGSGYSAQETIDTLAITPDGHTLISGDTSGWIRYWKLPEGAYYKHQSSLNASFVISPDGHFLIFADVFGEIIVWSLPAGDPLKTWQTNVWFIDRALAITPDSRLLASGGEDGTVSLWSLPNGALQRVLKGHQSPVTSLAVSPDGEVLASGSGDSTIRLWLLPEGTPLATLTLQNQGPRRSMLG